jgi:hypothetical protein
VYEGRYRKYEGNALLRHRKKNQKTNSMLVFVVDPRGSRTFFFVPLSGEFNGWNGGGRLSGARFQIPRQKKGTTSHCKREYIYSMKRWRRSYCQNGNKLDGKKCAKCTNNNFVAPVIVCHTVAVL